MPNPKVSIARPDIMFALAAVYVLGGSNYAAIALALDGFTPFVMLALRFGLAALILALLASFCPEQVASQRPIFVDLLVGLVLIGGTFGGIAMAQQRLDASGFVAVMLATAPMWAACLSAVGGVPLARQHWPGLALGLAGVGLLVGTYPSADDIVGVGYALFAALSLAVGSLVSNHLPQSKPRRSAAIQMAGAGVAFALIAFMLSEPLFEKATPQALLSVAYQAVFCSVISYTAFVYLLAHLNAAPATSFTYVNPIIAVLLGVVLLGEPLGSSQLIAIATILIGVWLLLSRGSYSKQGGGR